MVVITSLFDNLSSALVYLNQITTLECCGGVFKIHNWSGHDSHADNVLHRHSFFEVCYVTGGSGTYLDGHKEFRLKRGDLFCSRPQIWHRIHEGRSLGLLWMSFEIDESKSSGDAIEIVKRLEGTDHFFVRDAEWLPAVLAWQSILMQSSQRNGLLDIVQPLASGFLSALIGSFQISIDNADAHSLKNDPRRVLKQAKTFIADNLTQPLQLRDISGYLHMSERQLSRLFHDYETLTFVQYMRGERIRRAEELLSQSSKTIKEIAIECGFESVHYFTRVFAEAIGKPPGLYREGNP